MASFFGEIRPVVSRAVDDEDSDDEIIEAEFHWKPSQGVAVLKKFSPKWLILGIGSVAAGFLVCHNEMSKKLGVIVEVKKDVDVVDVYSNSNENVFYCITTTYIQPDKLWSLKQQIFQILSFQGDCKVCVLDSDTVYNFNTIMPSQNLQLPIIRYLKTSDHFDPKTVNMLEQPNMIKGLSATVLSHCELNKIEAILYICYTEAVQPDSATLKSFSFLLENEPFQSNQVAKVKTTQKINSFLLSPAISKGLYI